MESRITKQSNLLQSLSDDLHREYVRKAVAFCLVLATTIALWFTDTRSGVVFSVILLFAVAVDLLGIKRCQRICRIIDDHNHVP